MVRPDPPAQIVNRYQLTMSENCDIIQYAKVGEDRYVTFDKLFI
jgi:hypothetical protein